MFTYGLLVTIGSLCFMILLLMVFFKKKRFSTVRNRLYAALLIIVVSFMVSEIITLVALKYINNDMLTFILWRVHWMFGIVWFAFLFYYDVTTIKNLQAPNIRTLVKNNKVFYGVAIFIFIICIVYLFLPYERIDIHNLDFLPGTWGTISVMFFGVFTAFVIFCYLIKYRKTCGKDVKFSVVIMFVIIFLILAFQIRFQWVSLIPLGYALQMLFLYFHVENPDLVTITELQALKEDIDKSSNAKLDFLFNMSHDIRSPMNAIVGFSQSLKSLSNFDEKQVREDIENIKLSGSNLVDIINNVLDVSKIEQGEDSLQLKEYSLNNVVRDLPNIIQARIGDRPVQLVIEVDQNIPAKLLGDSTKLFQILMNILGNSAKYTEVGKIRMVVTGTQDRGIETLHFKLSDTGYGIKDEDKDKLFTKFNRLDDATDNEIEGTGLGLVITKKYVDLMGGKIWFESEHDVGTTFYIEIPQKILSTETLREAGDEVVALDENGMLDCSKFTALIVDDNKLNVKVAQRLLERYHFKVESLYNGKDCVYRVKEGAHYDIIFMDHMMPEMDGIRTLQILKKLDGYDIPPVIALTANAMNGMREMYLENGFNDYLAKPINTAELNRIIVKYFGNKINK